MTPNTNQGLFSRRDCPNCHKAGETIARTTIAEIGRRPKFRGPHYCLEKLELPPDTTFSIRWCAACALGFADPLLDQGHLSRLYNEVIVKPRARTIYAKSLDSRQRQVEMILNVLDRYKSKAEPRRLLDFGAGWGLLLHEARARAWEPHGIELAEEERASLQADGFRVYPALEEAPNDFFDAVGSTQVLEHVADFHALTEIHAKKLKAGGLLYIDVPNAGYFARRPPGAFANPLEHVNYFTRAFLTRRLVDRAALELVWPRLMAAPKQSWRAVRQAAGLAPLTVVFRKRARL